MVHRDIKPPNLMLDSQGRVKILDLGLAQIGPWQQGSDEFTTVGQLMGTLDYRAPEQSESSQRADYRSDLYNTAWERRCTGCFAAMLHTPSHRICRRWKHCG